MQTTVARATMGPSMLMKQIETETTTARNEVIESCKQLLSRDLQPLNKRVLGLYLDHAFKNPLPQQLTVLDASRPWIIYWIANCLAMLEEHALDADAKRSIYRTLFETIASSPNVDSNGSGPFGGGVEQLPHVAATYSAIVALVLCDNIDNCWDKIDTKGIYEWFLSLKQPDGGFSTCLPSGENDTRAVYCVLAVASLLGILTEELTAGVTEYLVRCQTYEGGFGGSPFGDDEAHGGYTYCAVASLAILGQLDKIDVERLMEWCSARQYAEEMGLSGRSNKLVDGCYSYWVGGTVAIIEAAGFGVSIDKSALQRYILNCCQDPDHPGLRDKPGKRPDFYHTTYGLMGLSMAESKFNLGDVHRPATTLRVERASGSAEALYTSLTPINPVYGGPVKNIKAFYEHFNKAGQAK